MDTAIGFSGSTMAWIAGSAALMLALKRLAKPRAEIR
jgi:hypothetical protein